MHELGITESVVSTVVEHTGDAKVTRVVLEIGRLSGVVPDAVRFCFEACTRGTPLEGATLEVVEIPAIALCRECSQEIELPGATPLCPCGGVDLEIRRGRELRIKEVEVI